MKIETILSQIDLGSMALPEFQRGYVWNREQVRRFVYSLYRRYPVGSLLTWVTKTEDVNARGDGQLAPGAVKLILDGQQRITSLYGIIRGKPPEFFDGNANAFTGLYFNLADENFEFYSKMKMADNPLWISVAELMQQGVGGVLPKLLEVPEVKEDTKTYINRLNAVEGIKNVDLHIEEVTGEDKTVDVVVDVFNRVNSGGTKLSKGDLALAKICGEWPDARTEMKKRLAKWERAGFSFRLELLLRCINAIITGEALFSALKDVDPSAFHEGLKKAERAVDKLLDLIGARLGLDHDRVLGSKYSFPLMARYLAQRNFQLKDHRERDKLLYWYVHTFLWGRYAGSTEAYLNQDLEAIEDRGGALTRVIDLLKRQRGHLRLTADDFHGHSRGARFYPLLYIMTRVGKAKDWNTGLELSAHLLGHLCRLQVHHIFPKAKLYEHGYRRNEANAIANFTFLTQETNLLVLDREPMEYLEEYVAKHPGAVKSHWIPMDRGLWKVDNYPDFLLARRELLAQAANRFLDSLLAGEVPESKPAVRAAEAVAAGAAVPAVAVPGGIENEDEERILNECNDTIAGMGLSRGEILYELCDAESRDPIAILDLAWPNGLQEGLTEPVALLIDESSETEEAVNRAGYRFFSSVPDFESYVRKEVLGEREPATTGLTQEKSST